MWNPPSAAGIPRTPGGAALPSPSNLKACSIAAVNSAPLSNRTTSFRVNRSAPSTRVHAPSRNPATGISSVLPSPHRGVQTFYQLHPAAQQFLVSHILRRPPVQYPVQSLPFHAPEFLVPQVGIVNDLRNALHLPVPDGELFAQRFKRAVVPAMTEPLFHKHVEGNRLGMGGGSSSENKSRLGINEPADQPGRRDAINPRTRSRHPDAIGKLRPLAFTAPSGV